MTSEDNSYQVLRTLYALFVAPHLALLVYKAACKYCECYCTFCSWNPSARWGLSCVLLNMPSQMAGTPPLHNMGVTTKRVETMQQTLRCTRLRGYRHHVGFLHRSMPLQCFFFRPQHARGGVPVTCDAHIRGRRWGGKISWRGTGYPQPRHHPERIDANQADTYCIRART